MVSTRFLSRFLSLTIATLAVLLTGCIGQQHFVFLKEEEWVAVQTLTLNSEDQQNPNPVVTGWIELLERVDERQDMESTLRVIDGEDGSRTYLLVARGQGYDKLEETLLGVNRQVNVNVVNGERQLSIIEDQSTTSFSSTGEPSEFSDDTGGILRITGGRIIESNADNVEEGQTAVWADGPFFGDDSLEPFTVNVTFTEADEFSPEMIALVNPPPDVDPALQEILSTMGSAANSTTANETTSSTATESETSPPEESGEAPSAEGDPSTAPEADTSTLAEPGESLPTDTNDDPESISDTTSRELPSGTNQTLPASGSTLTKASSTQLVWGSGLLLLVLIAAGVRDLYHRK